MNDKVILPPTYLEVIDCPLIFLAGPIMGAARWQDRAIKYITLSDPEVYVASPRRLNDSRDMKKEFSIDMYNEQIDWETHHLRMAGKNGAIMFWLAIESEHRCDRSYAQTSRFELGEWKVRHERDGAHLVVGIENGFSGARYMRKRLPQDCPEVPICSTLEDTCREAIRLARSKR